MSESTSPEPGANPGTFAPATSAERGAGSAPRDTSPLDILLEIASGLNGPGSPEQLFGGFLDTVVAWLGARAASVRLNDRDGHTRLVASRGLAPEVIERDRLMPHEVCACGWAAIEGGLRTQRGTGHCARLIERPMLERDCTEFVVVPIHYQDRILGVYNVFLDRPLATMGGDLPDLLMSVGISAWRSKGRECRKRRVDSQSWRSAISSATSCTTRWLSL